VSDTPDYYATLGLKPTATAADIKAAYRAAAKRAHPDAGGSAEAMRRVNEAHRVLADPAARADYDRGRVTQDRRPAASDAETSAGPTRHTAPHPAAQAAAHDFQRLRLSQARAVAWQLLGRSTLAAILMIIITRYAATLSAGNTAKILLSLAAFVPVYGVILAGVFLMSPQIRLDLHDLVHHFFHPKSPDPRLTRGEYAALIALALGFIPLALAWLLFFG
jgi:cation transport ATPase